MHEKRLKKKEKGVGEQVQKTEMLTNTVPCTRLVIKPLSDLASTKMLTIVLI